MGDSVMPLIKYSDDAEALALDFLEQSRVLAVLTRDACLIFISVKLEKVVHRMVRFTRLLLQNYTYLVHVEKILVNLNPVISYGSSFQKICFSKSDICRIP